MTAGAAAAVHQEETCSLLPGLFGIALQALLFSVSMGVLVAKKKVEEYHLGTKARDWQTFILDSSKQIFGAGWIHCLNLLCSHLLGEKFEGGGCEWYWVNIIFDTTLGVLVSAILLKSLVYALGIDNGSYWRDKEQVDHSVRRQPDWWQYGTQLALWLFVVSCMKSVMVVVMVIGSSTLPVVASKVLSYFPGGPKGRLIIVMVITPCMMNAFQFVITDQFLKKRHTYDQLDSPQEPLVTNLSDRRTGP